MDARVIWGALAGLSCAVAACSEARVGAPPSNPGASWYGARNGGREVPAGTRFSVALAETVGTDVSREGQTFRATVREPLRAKDGTVVVPAGAAVRGKVVTIHDDALPALAVDLETVETMTGEAKLQAKIEGAKAVPYPGELGAKAAPSFDGFFYSPVVLGYDPEDPGPATSSYPGTRYYDADEHAVRLPAGQSLPMTLTRPLTAPPAKR